MALLNYTTTVDAAKTCAEMQRLLAKGGALSIMATYDGDGEPSGMAFAIATPNGVRTYTLPVRATSVETVLRKQRVPFRYQNAAHARRVAWRILKDWLEAQLAIIETEMVTLDQVMLPYMHSGPSGETVYELYRDQQLALGAGTDDTPQGAT